MVFRSIEFAINQVRAPDPLDKSKRVIFAPGRQPVLNLLTWLLPRCLLSIDEAELFLVCQILPLLK